MAGLQCHRLAQRSATAAYINIPTHATPGLVLPLRQLRGICARALHHPAINPPRRGVSARLQHVSLASLSGSCVAPTLWEPEARPDPRVGKLLKACSVAFACAAGCALWATLACTMPAAAPLASASLAGPSPAAFKHAAESAWTGLAAGVLHTLCGPDHLAALTPLTIGRGRVAATALGALWGFGHSTGQFILGLIFIVLKERFHDLVPALSKWSGTIIGLTLVAIGVLGLYESVVEGGAHGEEHVPELNLAMAGADGSTLSPPTPAPSALKAAPSHWATYATGIVYGLQPDALFVVIPALALPTKLAAAAYCCMFVIGTVAAMGGYTFVIGSTSAALTKNRPWLQSHLSSVASGIAILVGLFVLLPGLGIDVPFMPAS